MLSVSTHSRLKAAGYARYTILIHKHGFNTQPPEGGWVAGEDAPEGDDVSTHSRLKAAGICITVASISACMFQHTAA